MATQIGNAARAEAPKRARKAVSPNISTKRKVMPLSTEYGSRCIATACSDGQIACPKFSDPSQKSSCSAVKDIASHSSRSPDDHSQLMFDRNTYCVK